MITKPIRLQLTSQARPASAHRLIGTMSFYDRVNAMAEDPRAQKALEMYKRVESGLWHAMEPIGREANRLAGRLGAEAFYPTELADGELEKAARILRTFTLDGAELEGDRTDAAESTRQKQQLDKAKAQPVEKDDTRKTQTVFVKIPAEALREAKGIAIMTCFRTGFGISGSSGSGVVIAKLPDGTWSPPSGILVHTYGYGFLIGADIYDAVLILRTDEALKSFEKTKFTIGGELSVAAGPVGSGAMLDSGLEASPCWSYTKSKGFYAGAQLDGTVILNRDDANARFYGERIGVPDILLGRVQNPPSVLKPLWQTLYAAEGRADYMGTDLIPQGDAPDQLEASLKETEELEDKEKGDRVVAEARQSLGMSPSVPGAAPGTSQNRNAQIPSTRASGATRDSFAKRVPRNQ